MRRWKRHSRFFRIAPGLCALVFSALALPAAGAAQELDDQPDYARIAAPYWDLETVIASESDVDWFRIPGETPGFLVIRHVQARQAPGVLDMALTDEEGAVLALSDGRWEGDDFLRVAAVGEGDHLLRLSGRPADAPYIFRIDRVEPRDTAEPNDTPETAADAYGMIFLQRPSLADQDWFRSSPDELSVLEIEVTRTGRAVPPFRAVILRPDGSERTVPLMAFEGPEDEQIQRGLINLNPGENLFRIGPDSASLAIAAVDFTLTPQNDAQEPNDTAGQSRPLTLNGAMKVARLFPGDDDWFHLDLEESATLIITLTVPEGGAVPNLLLYGEEVEAGTLGLEYGRIANSFRLEAEPGRYYLRLYTDQWVDMRAGLSVEREQTLAAAADAGNTRFYMLGLEAAEGLRETLDAIARAGQGEVVDVPEGELELAETLARVATETRDERYSMADRLRTGLRVTLQRIFEIRDEAFSAKAFAASATELVNSKMGGGPGKRDFTPRYLPETLNRMVEEQHRPRDSRRPDAETMGRLLDTALRRPFTNN